MKKSKKANQCVFETSRSEKGLQQEVGEDDDDVREKKTPQNCPDPEIQ